MIFQIDFSIYAIKIFRCVNTSFLLIRLHDCNFILTLAVSNLIIFKPSLSENKYLLAWLIPSISIFGCIHTHSQHHVFMFPLWMSFQILYFFVISTYLLCYHFFFRENKTKEKKFNTELIIIQLFICHRRKEKWNTWLSTVVHKKTLLHKDIFQPHITSILQGYLKEHHIFFCWRYDIHHAISIIHKGKQSKIEKNRTYSLPSKILNNRLKFYQSP